MKIKLLLVLPIAALPLSFIRAAPEPTPAAELSTAAAAATPKPDPTNDLDREIRDREAKILTLTIDEQLKLRAVQLKAAEDPAVKEAVEKRNKAVQEFRTKFREAMIKIDPSVEAVLDRITVGSNPGF
ncbi:MAG: hypothetical protein ABJB09_06450 [Verrucomicrobiota bacterium]